MSASREKQNRQALSASGQVLPKTAREAQRLKEEKRTRLLYGIGAVVFVGIVAFSVLWNSNVFSRSATAVKVDGQEYSAAQVAFYYHSAYAGFVNSGWNYFVNLDTSKPLESQTLDESAAGMLDAEVGITYKEYFLNSALERLASVQNGLKEAQEENFEFPESVQSDFDESMESLSSSAKTNGTGVGRFLQNVYGVTMTEKVYRTEMLRTLQYAAYQEARRDRLSYTEEEIEAKYTEDADDYDLVSYEALAFDGAVPEEPAEEPAEVEEPVEAAVPAESAASGGAAASDGSTSDGAAASDDSASDGAVTSDGSASDGAVTSDDSASDGAVTSDDSASDGAVTSDDSASEGETAEEASEEETTDAEAAEEEESGPSEEEIEAARAAAQEAAEAALTLYRSGTALSALETPEHTYSASEGASNSDIISDVSSSIADWLFDGERKAGDSAVLVDGDTFYTVVFRDRFRDEGKSTVDVRHILITPSDRTLTASDGGYAAEQEELKAAAEAKAEEVYNLWKDGEATEDSFAELAKEYTADSNGEDGGLYEGVTEGQMVSSFNDWIFDPARQSGDTDIVETEYGYHIMYYVGDNHPRWHSEAEDALRTQDFADWTESLHEEADIQRVPFGMKFVG